MKNNARANRILNEYHGEYRKVGVQRRLDDVVRWMCDERECHGCPSRSSMHRTQTGSQAVGSVAEIRIFIESLDQRAGLTLTDLENMGFDIDYMYERRFNRHDTSTNSL